MRTPIMSCCRLMAVALFLFCSMPALCSAAGYFIKRQLEVPILASGAERVGNKSRSAPYLECAGCFVRKDRL